MRQDNYIRLRFINRPRLQSEVGEGEQLSTREIRNNKHIGSA